MSENNLVEEFEPFICDCHQRLDKWNQVKILKGFRLVDIGYDDIF